MKTAVLGAVGVVVAEVPFAEDAGAIAGLLQNIMQQRRRGSFAVGASDVQRGELVFGMIEKG